MSKSRKANACDDAEACDMRGMLSFQILWLLSKQPMYGQELAEEIGKRKGGDKLTPGTIYPALKDLSRRELVRSHAKGNNNVYELTPRGQVSLTKSLEHFRKAFGEIFDPSLAIEVRKKSG